MLGLDVLAIDDGGGIGQLVAIAAFLIIGAIGSLLGKKREKQKEQEKAKPQWDIPEAEGPGDEPRPAAPTRRPPVRGAPPRARPPRRRPPVPVAEPGRPGEPDLQPAPVLERPRARPPRRKSVSKRARRSESDRVAKAALAEQIASRSAQPRRRADVQAVQRTGPPAPGAECVATPARQLLQLPLDRNDLRRAIILYEILAPPVSQREQIQ